MDKKTGRLATTKKNSVLLRFKRGTEPQDSEPERCAVDANQFMMTP